MNALLDSNTGQNAFAIPCPEKLAVCANEPQKLLIPKELHPQCYPQIPSKTPKIPLKTPQKTQKTVSRTPENRCHRRLSPTASDKHRDGTIRRRVPKDMPAPADSKLKVKPQPVDPYAGYTRFQLRIA
jgi:hypothetical protein